MTDSKKKTTGLHLLASVLGAVFLYLFGKTSFTTRQDNPEYLSLRRKKSPIIYAFWHNTQVFLAYLYRRKKISILVSRSKDGEYIAQVMKRMGLNPVRGSTSKGGAEALRELISLLEQGRQIGFTPDGPKGPLQTVHGGVVTAAKLSGVPIVPLGVSVSRKIEFNSWDKFVLPLPFSRNVVVHGKPFRISNETSDEEAKTMVRNALNAAAETSDRAGLAASSWGACLLAQLIRFLYSFLGILLLPLWLPVLMMKFGISRSISGMKDRLGFGTLPPAKKRRIWLHSASIGECQALKPLIEKLKTLQDDELFITVSTPEAKKMMTEASLDIPVSLLPADLPWIMCRWVKKVNPDAVVIIETELWPNFIHCLHKKDVPVFVVNGRLSARSAKHWKLLKPFIRNIFDAISVFYVRSEQDARRFCGLGAAVEKVHVSGNLKSDDLVIVTRDEKEKKRDALFGFKNGVLMAAGSTWPGEEEMVLKIFDHPGPDPLRLILAPRRLRRVQEVAELLKSRPRSWSTWSKVKAARVWATDILLVDTLGDLKELYQTADLAFIGGTFNPRGGQNPLEPASARLPLLFGHSMENFQEEARRLTDLGAARSSRTEADFLDDVQNLLRDKTRRELMGDAAADTVKSQQGVADRIFSDLRTQMGL